MAHYVVRAKLKDELAQELRSKLASGAFKHIRPFGRGLSDALERAHRDPDTNDVVWEEQCFCTPPLRMERAAVLDRYFNDIDTEPVNEGEGWRRLAGLPPLWQPNIDASDD